jgi:aspartyl-tRNA(Asn)/glutamyl-tRNA(Gln) amidotransferase subunit A
MDLHPLRDETIAGVAQAIRGGRRTCVDVVEGCLAQIDAWESKVHAWVSIDREGALAQASELDRELKDGRVRGALYGIPLGIKDLVDVKGWPTAAGAPWLTNAVAAADAPIVERLRGAGAIILGKTVTTQFACFDPPPTRNPWNLERTPGGSSSGSAAAVATGMCLGAIGSQTGGSITRPASFCGIAGCKPSFGLVPVQGVYPLSSSMDHPGPFARTVEDLAILLAAIVDPADRGRFTAIPKIESVRLGRLRGMFADRAEPQARSVFEKSLDHFARGGATVTDLRLPPAFDDVLRCHRIIMTTELAAHHREMLPRHSDEYLPGIRSLIEEGLQVDRAEYDRCKAHQQSLKDEIAAAFRDVDVLACPAAMGPAPTTETTGDPAFNAPWSYTGLPTVSFPIGLSAEGLPLAIQLVGRLNDETTLFAAAAWCERHVGQVSNLFGKR